jgi:hypothetical protein
MMEHTPLDVCRCDPPHGEARADCPVHGAGAADTPPSEQQNEPEAVRA